MSLYGHRFRPEQLSRKGTAALAAAACLSLYLLVRPTLSPVAKSPKTNIVRVKDRGAGADPEDPEKSAAPYPPELFPGGRDVETVYGTIRVFEWGPEEGEKVLLVHGIGTPCIAMGDMAWELVKKGYRVMLFGTSFFILCFDIVLFFAPTKLLRVQDFMYACFCVALLESFRCTSNGRYLHYAIRRSFWKRLL